MKIFCQLFMISVLTVTVCLGCAHNQKVSIEPDQLAGAVSAGAPALPYFVYSRASIPALNQAFKNAGAAITLEDAYLAAYQFSFEDLPPDGNTGQEFADMAAASRYLQKILKSRDVADFQNYFMTSIDTANADGFILVAAIYRPEQTISVFNKFNFLARETLSFEDPAFFRAYRIDVDQNPLDTVYEWAALPVDCVSYQIYQAVLLTLTANTILEKKAQSGYWSQERQWIAGNHLAVLIKQDIKVSQALGLEKGFTRHMNISHQ
jgi:hypothetical protein